MLNYVSYLVSIIPENPYYIFTVTMQKVLSPRFRLYRFQSCTFCIVNTPSGAFPRSRCVFFDLGREHRCPFTVLHVPHHSHTLLEPGFVPIVGSNTYALKCSSTVFQSLSNLSFIRIPAFPLIPIL